MASLSKLTPHFKDFPYLQMSGFAEKIAWRQNHKVSLEEIGQEMTKMAVRESSQAKSDETRQATLNRKESKKVYQKRGCSPCETCGGPMEHGLCAGCGRS